jgi:hypothetical protein
MVSFKPYTVQLMAKEPGTVARRLARPTCVFAEWQSRACTFTKNPKTIDLRRLGVFATQ